MRTARASQAVLITVITMITLPLVVPAAQQTLLNGSYENGVGPVGPQPNVPDQWTLFGPFAERSLQVNLSPANGEAALKAFGADTTGAYQDAPAVAGDTVVISASMLTLGSDQIGGDASAGISLEFLDSGEAVIEQLELLAFDSASTADVWTLVTTTGLAPVGTTTARMVCVWTNTGTAAGSAFWDDCVLTVNSGTNLLDNGDFEAAAISTQSPIGIDDWTGFETQEMSEDFAFVGTSSLKLLASGSGGGSFNGLFQDLGIVEAGDRILFRAWALHPSSDPLTQNAQAGIKLEFLAADDDPDLPDPVENLPINENADTNAWILVNLSTSGVIVPPDANFARVIMIYDVGTSSLATNGLVWFDDAEATLNNGSNQLFNPSFESGTGGANGINFWTEFGLPPLATTRKAIPFDGPTPLAFDGLAVAQSRGILTTGIFQDVAVEPGELLNVSARLQVPGGSAFSPGAAIRAGVKVEWQGGSRPSNVDIGLPTNTIRAGDPTDQWKELFIDFTLPLGTRANLRFTNLLGFVGSGTAYLDAAEAVIVNRVAGADVDGNGTMDLADFAVFQRCHNGNGANFVGWPCLVFDAEEDNDVDVDDWSLLDPENNLTGP